MAVTAASLMTEFGATGADETVRDINQVHQAVNRATGGFNLLGTAVGTAGGFLIGQAISKGIGMVTGLGRSMITSSAQAETLGLALETAVGDRAKQVYADLQQFAKLTPFEFPELIGSTIMLENFGIRANETIKGVGRTWMEVAGDTAASMAGQGVTIDQVTSAVTDAVMGENERLKELGIKASIEGDRIKYSYIANGKEMTAFADRNSQEMIASTIAGIWNDKYGGAMEKQSRSFNGMRSTLADNWSMTMQRLGEDVFDFAKIGLKHSNLFFDRFNVGLDRGMSPFHAGLRALKFSLQDVFGKGPVNKIWSGMEGMFGLFESGGRHVFNVASGVKNLTFGLGAAFFEGNRERFFRQLPGWLQQSARYAGTVAEGFGDIYRAFRENGIGGAWDAITGGEVRQIANAAVDLVIDAVPRLGEWLWDQGTDLASWLWSKIPGVSTPQVGDGTGGPEFDASTKPFTIPVLMDLAAQFGKWVWGEAGDLGSWLFAQAWKAGEWVVGSAIPATLDFIAKYGDMAWGELSDFGSWIKNELPDLAADGVEASLSFLGKYGGTSWGEYGSDFGSWFKASVGALAATVDAAITVSTDENNAAFDQGKETGKGWGEKFSQGLTSGFESVFGGGEGGEGSEGTSGGGFIGSVFGAMGSAADWLTSPHYLTFEGEIAGFVAGVATTFKDNFTSNMKLLFWDQPIDWGTSLGDWSAGIWDDISETLRGSWEDATSPFEGLGDTIGGWIGDEFDSISTWLTENTPEFIKKLADGDVMGAVRSLFGGDSGGGGAPARTPSPIPQADLEWYGDYFGSQPYGGRTDPKTGTPGFEPSGMTIPARLDLDTSDAMTKLAALTGGGNQKTLDSPFKATFDLDTADASTKKTEAMLWGTTWAGAEYASAFNINDADAVAKKDSAFLSGMNWAGSVFTARFSVDISPLETALTRTREITQELSDLLPRSPARKGPLARPISFNYIGDALKSAMRGMARDAELGMSALTGTLGGPMPAAGRGRASGNTTNVYVVTVPPDEWVELARKVERGESIDLNLARELAVRKAKAVS